MWLLVDWLTLCLSLYSVTSRSWPWKGCCCCLDWSNSIQLAPPFLSQEENPALWKASSSLDLQFLQLRRAQILFLSTVAAGVCSYFLRLDQKLELYNNNSKWLPLFWPPCWSNEGIVNYYYCWQILLWFLVFGQESSRCCSCCRSAY